MEPAGDLHAQGFDEIWETSDVFATLRTQDYSGSCGTCDYKDGCGGCRARAAYYHEGDFMAADEYCAFGKQLLRA
jgi:radical SAM protein with 4Fe4S-binding SPASM domain